MHAKRTQAREGLLNAIRDAATPDESTFVDGYRLTGRVLIKLVPEKAIPNHQDISSNKHNTHSVY